MSTLLARWLADNRITLLPRWIALLEEAPHAASGNGVRERGPGEAVPAPQVQVAHPDERGVLLTSIYDGLLHAADGDPASLALVGANIIRFSRPRPYSLVPHSCFAQRPQLGKKNFCPL